MGNYLTPLCIASVMDEQNQEEPKPLEPRVKDLEEYQHILYEFIDELRAGNVELRAGNAELRAAHQDHEKRMLHNERRMEHVEDMMEMMLGIQQENQAIMSRLVDKQDNHDARLTRGGL